jgi:hypothetical protein
MDINGDNFYVEINYANGSTVVIESVGPNSVVGFVKDAVFGHFTESPSRVAVQDIRIGTKLASGPRVALTQPEARLTPSEVER